MKRYLCLFTLLAVALIPLNGEAAVVQIQGGGATAPAGWNVMAGPSNDIIGLIDSEGATTAYDLITDDTLRFNGVNQSGTTNAGVVPAGFPTAVTANSWFGNTSEFSGGIFPEVQWTFQNLDQSSTYDFVFYGSRMGANDNRETTYTLSGANSGSGSLDVANNESGTVSVGGITPDALGQIQLNIAPGANNTNGSGFFYLGGMTMTSVTAIPEPSSMLALGIIGAASVIRRRKR